MAARGKWWKQRIEESVRSHPMSEAAVDAEWLRQVKAAMAAGASSKSEIISALRASGQRVTFQTAEQIGRWMAE